MKKIFLFFLCIFIYSCSPGEVKPGEIKFIYLNTPGNGYAIGTDSSIIIINSQGNKISEFKRYE